MAFLSTAAQNAAATAVGNLANSGTLKIYSGTIPASANTAISTQTVLASITLSTTAFGSAGSGQISLAGVPLSDPSADAGGVASFFRVIGSDGTTVVFQGTVGQGTGELSLSNTTIVATGTVTVTGLTYTQAAS